METSYTSFNQLDTSLLLDEFPIYQFIALLNEISEDAKKKFLQLFSHTRLGRSKTILDKDLLTVINKEVRNPNLVLQILNLIQSTLINDIYKKYGTEQDLLRNEASIRQTYGPAHLYFALWLSHKSEQVIEKQYEISVELNVPTALNNTDRHLISWYRGEVSKLQDHLAAVTLELQIIKHRLLERETELEQLASNYPTDDKKSCFLQVYDELQINLVNNMQSLLETRDVGDKKLRQNLLSLISFIDSYESICSQFDIQLDIPIEKIENSLIEETTFHTNEKDQHLGIFTRLASGGNIEFEDGSTKYVAEAFVIATGLEHNAIISCRLKEDGRVFVESIISEGDDTLADITKHTGIIKVNDDSFYCVDIESHENKTYSLHYRDKNHWNPNDGDPLLFNVGNDDIARISKLFPYDENELSPKMKVKNTTKKSEETKPVKQAFLNGCKIVIFGGVEKWFSDTVKSTGAILVHNTGHNPQRAFTELKTANAVFFLLTSTSHKSTWGAFDLAKQLNIPYFTIQGSRSNLYQLLWDNQELIRKKQT